MYEIEQLKDAIVQTYNKSQYEDCLCLMSSYANIMYQYNQEYIDDELEDILQAMGSSICVGQTDTIKTDKPIDVLFYDGFGLDNRGLALQYLSALIKSGLHIAYVVKKAAIEKIPTITSILNTDQKSVILTYDEKESYVNKSKYLYSLTNKISPKTLFVYMHPADVSAALAFNCIGNVCERYYIDLTDHAFWIGKNVADYFIEFREYGANVARQYRHIPEEQIIMLPFYPFVNQWKKFEGFPFDRDGKIVIFSGGSLYKTFDGQNNAYYRVIENCLDRNDKIVFWYAGSGNNSELLKLESRFPNRVVHTKERQDLLEVLKNCDIYFNTYPQTGGLMMQYAAISGKAPITLESSVSGGGELINEDKLEIKFKTVNDTVDILLRMSSDSSFRKEVNERVKDSVITEKCFQENLVSIINDRKSQFDISYKEIDTADLRDVYCKRFGKNSFERHFHNDALMPFLKCSPILTSRIFIYKVKQRLMKRKM
ncbi:hypothetical protein SAMN04487771_10266 [[Clostridium] aminophilum]|uniref:Glycosyl transferases group 1 n=1 Tax=[Clostridium] aminophilum TaxID=1526 RepID=A0A1I0FI04_9FIRM|nr:glycosyltransferase family 4 protein [[Clostridium] aminophilum]SET57949.1 hypothetical protein SAMN04487771_10266 [[Clostridium] aminophilum]